MYSDHEDDYEDGYENDHEDYKGGNPVATATLLGLGIGIGGLYYYANNPKNPKNPKDPKDPKPLNEIKATIMEEQYDESITYYHVSADVINGFDDNIFKKKQGFMSLNEPVGLYYTSYTAGYTANFMMLHCPKKCVIYSFTIPKEYITTIVAKNPNKVLRLTKSNWRHFSDYIKTHSLQNLYDDFAGIDSNDYDFNLDYYNYQFSINGIKEINSYLKSHPDDHFGNVFFPRMFSNLRLNNISPEGCIWRASAWINKSMKPYDLKNIKNLFKNSAVSNIIKSMDDIKNEENMLNIAYAVSPANLLLVLPYATLKESDIIKYKADNAYEELSYDLARVTLYVLKTYTQLDNVNAIWYNIKDIKPKNYELNQFINGLYMAKYIELGKNKAPLKNEPEEIALAYFVPTYNDIPEIKFENNDNVMIKLTLKH